MASCQTTANFSLILFQRSQLYSAPFAFFDRQDCYSNQCLNLNVCKASPDYSHEALASDPNNSRMASASDIAESASLISASSSTTGSSKNSRWTKVVA